MAELAAVRRQAPGTFTWWVDTLRGYLDDADRRGQLPDLTPLVREGSSADPRTALAEYMVARWAGVQQAALASGRNDLRDRVVTSWVILLPWLSNGPAARDELFAFIRELSSSTLRDSDRPAPD
jgi:hypothetical protein